MLDKLQQILKEITNSNMKITVTIEPNNGLTGSQVEEARQKGRQGQDIYFKNTDSTL